MVEDFSVKILLHQVLFGFVGHFIFLAKVSLLWFFFCILNILFNLDSILGTWVDNWVYAECSPLHGEVHFFGVLLSSVWQCTWFFIGTLFNPSAAAFQWLVAHYPAYPCKAEQPFLSRNHCCKHRSVLAVPCVTWLELLLGVASPLQEPATSE